MVLYRDSLSKTYRIFVKIKVTMYNFLLLILMVLNVVSLYPMFRDTENHYMKLTDQQLLELGQLSQEAIQIGKIALQIAQQSAQNYLACDIAVKHLELIDQKMAAELVLEMQDLLQKYAKIEAEIIAEEECMALAVSRLKEIQNELARRGIKHVFNE